MQHHLAAAAATTVLMIASAASAQPYNGPPGAAYAPSAGAWRANSYGAARPYGGDHADYRGARYDYGGRYGDAYSHGPSSRYGSYGYAPNRTYGGWGARFTLPFRPHAQSHR